MCVTASCASSLLINVAEASVEPLSYRKDYHGTNTVNDFANNFSGIHIPTWCAPLLTLKSLSIRECFGLHFAHLQPFALEMMLAVFYESQNSLHFQAEREL